MTNRIFHSPSSRRLYAVRREVQAAQSGNVAIIFALSLMGIAGVAGMGLDFGRTRTTQTVLQQAADAAALAAAKNPEFSTTQATQIALASLTANGRGAMLSSPLTSSISRTGGADPAVEISLSATVNTTFMSLFGYKTLPVNAAAKASLSLRYSVVYAAIDMSESMGLAADAAARTALNAATDPYYAGGCMFGCHQRDGWEPGTKTVYQIAKDNGIALREDVLNSAFGKLVDLYLDPTDASVTAGRREMALYGFSDDATLLQATTNNAGTIKSAMANFPDAMRLNTNFNTSLTTIRSQIGPQGNGTPGNPKKTILLVTDGVAWIRNGAGDHGPIDQTLCDSIKADGFTLAIVEVQYQDATGEYWFDTQVSPFYSQISPSLQSCASPGYYFQATDSDAATLATTFNNAANTLRAQLALTK